MSCILQTEDLEEKIRKLERKISEEESNLEKEISKVEAENRLKTSKSSKHETDRLSRDEEAKRKKQYYETRINDAKKKISSKKESIRRLKDEIKYFQKFDTV